MTMDVLEIVRREMWRFEAENECANKWKISLEAAIGLVEDAILAGRLRAYSGRVCPGGAKLAKVERLMESRRRLGPYTALQGSEEPFRLCDAEIARRVAELLEVVLELANELDTIRQQYGIFCADRIRQRSRR